MSKVSLSKKVVVSVLISVACIFFVFNAEQKRSWSNTFRALSSSVYDTLHVKPLHTPCMIETVWGTETITDPCAIDIINTSLMQRLHHIDQSGPQSYFGMTNEGKSLIVPHFSRFEHSLGVYLLLVKAGASHDEQIAGLMHDASHTVFSHIGDLVFGKGDGAKSYQDGIHIDYLSSYDDVKKVLHRYSMHLEDMDPDKEEYTALERPLPDLCADRIQYIIHTGVLLDCINKQEAREIVQDLEFKNGIWFFKSKEIAYRFASISLYCLQALWGGHVNAFFYLIFKHMLLRALELKLVTAHDLHYSIDQTVLDVLLQSNDPYIQRLMKYTHNWEQWYKVVPYDQSDINYRIKFRGVNPFVLINGELQRLTAIDSKYADEYEREKLWCKTGYGLKLSFSLDV